MCEYNGVRMKYAGFLNAKYGIDVSGNSGDEHGKKQQAVFMGRDPEDSFILARGETLRQLGIIGDKDSFPYFLVVKNDQLICARKISGEIVWSKHILGYKTSQFIRLNTNLVLKAKLYGGTLVIFDGINLFGTDPATGDIIWAVSNRDEDPVALLHYQRRIRKANLAVVYNAHFDDRCVIYYKKGNLFFIDPVSGYCYSRLDTKTRFVTGMHTQNDFLACFYIRDGMIGLYDFKKGEKIEESSIAKFLPEGIVDKKDAVIETMQKLVFINYSDCFKYPGFFLQVDNIVKRFDPAGNLLYKRNVDESVKNQWYISNIGGKIISYSPFWKLICLNDETGKTEYEIRLTELPHNALANRIFPAYIRGYYRYHESQLLHICGYNMIVPEYSKGKFLLSAFDCRDGNGLWKIFIQDLYPEIWHISNSEIRNGNIGLCMTFKEKDSPGDVNLRYMQPITVIAEAGSGRLIKKVTSSMSMLTSMYGHSMGAVNDTFIINENNMRLRCERVPR